MLNLALSMVFYALLAKFYHLTGGTDGLRVPTPALGGLALERAPEEIDALERKKLQLEIEREALRKEKAPDSLERLKAIEAEIA
ncbi:hypothetical protein L6232_23795, partial [Shewanella sp. C31]|nr:hypothetical protein [Shewanella electrica]